MYIFLCSRNRKKNVHNFSHPNYVPHLYNINYYLRIYQFIYYLLVYIHLSLICAYNYYYSFVLSFANL